MPPVCLWEIVAGLAQLRFGSAFRRLQKNVQATGFRGKTFSVHYHSPARFAQAFAHSFDLREIRGLNIISAPPHAARLARRYPRISSMLESVEDRIDRLPLWRAMGDHYMATFIRR
jgi:hypothetical protein